ncbi:neutral zinc metallopeptidase [soil metagenome]
MRWGGRRESGNIEDRRGQEGGFGGIGGGPRLSFPGGGRAGGGLGIGAVAIILVVGWFLGINPMDVLSTMDGSGQVSTGTGSGSQPAGRIGVPSDDPAKFVSVILADNEDTWGKIFSANSRRYEVPTLVLFTGQTSSACGFATAASGPFYCPGDRKVYIDLAFYRELKDKLNAPGDFAQAYVIAHEIGHHVQNLLGTLPKVEQQRRQASQSEGNRLTVRLELQADCYAGVWGHSANQRGLLDPGDIDEALNAASQIGDDTLQRRTQGRVVPDSFTHGTSEQRSRWFKRGFADGNISACDTFGASQL